jgi:hypothetical protein
VVSDLDRGQPIWFGGEDRSETSMGQFYDWQGARCAGKKITGSAASQGITTSPLSVRFVMPRRRRFDSCFVAGKQPRTDYLRTFARDGVATSARRY